MKPNSKPLSDSNQSHLSDQLSKSPRVADNFPKKIRDDGKPNPKSLSDSSQAQLPIQPAKSDSVADNKTKVNAGKDMRAEAVTVVNLHGTVLSNLDLKQFKTVLDTKEGCAC